MPETFLTWSLLPRDLYAPLRSHLNALSIDETGRHIHSLLLTIDASCKDPTIDTRSLPDQSHAPSSKAPTIVKSLTTQEPRYPPGLSLPQQQSRRRGRGSAL